MSSIGTTQTPAFKTPYPYETPRGRMDETPVRAPFASSTPFADRSSSRPNINKERKTRDTPCSSCQTSNVHLLKRPSPEEPKSHPCSSRIPKRPPPISPKGYVDTSIEVDDKPFVSPLPGSEQTTEERERIMNSVDQCTRLFDFVRLIAPTTCDQGQMLNYVATAELAQFKEFVDSMFKARMQDTEELLGKEQLKLKERYEGWEAAVFRRAQTGVRTLKRILPEFKYDHYEKDPEYLYLMLREVRL